MSNKLYITEDGVKREMTLEEKNQYKKDVEEFEKIKMEQEAQKELKISAYKKLGLTDEEIAAII